MNTMWNTPEANAWARNFDYSDYVSLYKKEFPTGTPFKEKTYLEFCTVFENLMLRSFKNSDSG